MQPIHINESFTCQHCGHNVPKAISGCRNHCTECLYSLHVDASTPGDRASSCHALMKPVGVDHTNKGLMIVYSCTGCTHTFRVKQAPDDNVESIASLIYTHNQNLLRGKDEKNT